MNPLEIQLSIIVVCTNEKRFLGAGLSSLFQNLRDIPSEVIVVDNASADGSPEFIKTSFPGVLLVENPENRGAAYARNRGIEKARGEYLVFLDCDTEVVGDVLSKLLEYMKTHKEIGILSPRLIYPDGSLQYSCRPFPNFFIFLLRLFWDGSLEKIKKFKSLKHYFMTDWDHLSTREVDWTMSAAWLVPRFVIERVGRFDEGYFYNYEDVDLSWRMKRAGFKNVYYPEGKVIHHYQRLSSKGGVLNPLKWYHLKSALRFFVKKTFS